MNTNETVVDIEAEIGEKSDFCRQRWLAFHEWVKDEIEKRKGADA